MPERRFPPPWTAEDLGSCFVVKDSNGQRGQRGEAAGTVAEGVAGGE